ncbi:BLUF domain-containing protein [Brevundimonas subvibrioides]|uniref:BLUF domain-containing protein n=1 Tax=Brevundimonas subvibrioides TaxID=74313 RepID=UPI0022B525C6|nr:BLUF domain-containing protein [Brevundimonas subvibrioides]
MTSPIERIVYRSDAVALTDGPVDVSPIISTSVRNNARRRLTGALALQGGTFVQVLEGDPDALTVLMETIETDDRHRNVRVLARWPVQVQLFMGWAMVHVDTRALSSHHSRLLTQTGSGAQVTNVLADLASARLGSVVPGMIG